jgi:hypothetical protein
VTRQALLLAALVGTAPSAFAQSGAAANNVATRPSGVGFDIEGRKLDFQEEEA